MSLRLLGRRLWPDDESEYLPMKTIAACLSLGLEGDGNIKNDESSIHIDNGLRVGDDCDGTKQA